MTKLGPLEITTTQQRDGSWRYDVLDTRVKDADGNRLEGARKPVTHGFRPNEHQAKADGWSDASMIRMFC